MRSEDALVTVSFRQSANYLGLAAALLAAGATRSGLGQTLPTAPAPQTSAQPAQAPAQANLGMQQRMLGMVPSALIVYTPHPVPLTPKQKFQLALKGSISPMSVLAAGVSGAYGQWTDDPDGFKQGADGYFKRVGMSYGANQVGNMIGTAIVPSILKQDPRYFYKGTGSLELRFFYAAANSFICMGDNGRWQMNVSQVTGSMATAGITELEYPPRKRLDLERVSVDFLLSEAGGAAKNIFQEFFIRRGNPSIGGRTQTSH